MPPLKVLTYPDKRLRLKAGPVEHFDEALQSTVKAMFETMYEDEAVGLAAIQVNVPYRIIVIDTSAAQNKPQCLINPEILEAKGQVLSPEGCLSLPDIAVTVKRFESIHIRYQDEYGVTHEKSANDLDSLCIQHEIDHLDGILAIDRVSKLKRNLLIKKMKKAVAS